MSELTPKEIRNLERLAAIVEKGDLAIFDNLIETEQKVEDALKTVDEKVAKAIAEVKASVPDIKSLLEQVKGKDGVTPKKGVDYVDGVPGKDYVLTANDKKEIARSIDVPVVEKVIEKTNTITVKEQPIVTHEIQVKEVAVMDVAMLEKELPKNGPLIRDGLELLPDGEKLKIEAIQGLEEELNKLKKRPTPLPEGGLSGAAARDLVKDIDLSDQLDGILSTFSIQSIWNIISVNLSSYPYGSLRKNIDYTWTPTSITFTSTIDPATQLSAGQQCILTVIQGA